MSITDTAAAPAQTHPISGAPIELALSSPAYRNDRLLRLAELHANRQPLIVNVPFLGKVKAVYTHEDVARLLRDDETFALNPATAGKTKRLGFSWWMPKAFRRLGDNMLGQDGAAHKRLRSLVTAAFNRRGVEAMQPRINEIAVDMLAPFRNGQPFDLVSDFARPFPLRVISELLGLHTTRETRFARIAPRVSNVDKPWAIPRMIAGVFELNKLFEEEIVEARAGNRSGLIAELVAETDDAAGEAMLTHEELLTMLFLLLFAGHETTVHLISSGTYSLCQHGTNGHFGPDRDTAAKLTAVNELMRYCSPVEMTETRYARTPTEIGGHTLNAGDTVISFFSAANHDPTVFDDPSTLRLDRHPNPQLGFGGGAHFCLGAQLARIEAAIAFSELFGGDSKLALVAPDAAPSWAPAPAMHGHQSLMVRFSG